jgi:hypothetical protein
MYTYTYLCDYIIHIIHLLETSSWSPSNFEAAKKARLAAGVEWIVVQNWWSPATIPADFQQAENSFDETLDSDCLGN